MNFEVTRDMEELKAILTIRPCYIKMGNDSTPKREDFKIENPDRFTAVIAKGPDGNEAAFLIFPKGDKQAEIHFTFVPTAWGQTKAIARGFLKWVWENTEFDRLLGPLPSHNRLALQLAQSVGFTQYDVEVGVGKKHGQEFNRIMLECIRPAQGAAAHA